ncbi:MAG: hypothetical protein A2X94_01775 [Bdellovibrionales bacterium GWB1_55_8]|nr:MAG: hypothetical protein A2X94_01775 [Bdellovibrionales bacterium GWB1_55_8]
MEICLVLPAYNEEGCIASVISSWVDELSKWTQDFRVLVIDDGSTDRTGDIVHQLSLEQSRLMLLRKNNSGHGGALFAGYAKAIECGAIWIFQVDTDAQFQAKDFSLLWERREASRFILGHRKERQDGRHRDAITWALKLLLLVIFGVRIRDPNIPFRLMRVDYLASLLSRLPDTIFAPNLFLSILAARDGENLFFIPVAHFARKTGSASLFSWRLLKACIRSAFELVRFRYLVGIGRTLR